MSVGFASCTGITGPGDVWVVNENCCVVLVDLRVLGTHEHYGLHTST